MAIDIYEDFCETQQNERQDGRASHFFSIFLFFTTNAAINVNAAFLSFLRLIIICQRGEKRGTVCGRANVKQKPKTGEESPPLPPLV